MTVLGRESQAPSYDQLQSMTVEQLKVKAEKEGVKKVGEGWPTCCPPTGNKEDIRRAIEKHYLSSQQASMGPPRRVSAALVAHEQAVSFSGSEPEPTVLDRKSQTSSYDELHNMTLEQLKKKAEEEGVKKKKVGWPTCCPPTGNKEDIRRAIHEHYLSSQQASRGPPRRESIGVAPADGGIGRAVVAAHNGYGAGTNRNLKGARGLCIAAPDIDLDFCFNDCDIVSEMLKSKDVLMEPIFRCDPKERSKLKVLQTIHGFLRQGAKVYVIYYSGHGSKGEPGETHGGRTGGALCVGCADDDAGLVTLDDLVRVWKAVRSRGQRLVLVVDACYSGKLWAKSRNIPKPEQVDLGLAIQAAGNARQCVSERAGGAGTRHAGKEFKNGFFTGYWVAKQESPVRWTVEEQHPQFYATWAYDSCDRTVFEIELGTDRKMVMYSQPGKR